MSVSLVTQDFSDQFDDLLLSTTNKICIISPFIGQHTSKKLVDWLSQNPHIECTIITRFYREDFIQNASSIYGVELLFQAGVKMFALKALHSKLYIFDDHSSIVGSANFTSGGFFTNFELAILCTDEKEVVSACLGYFQELVEPLSTNKEAIITQEWIDIEKAQINKSNQGRGTNSKEYNIFQRGAELPRVKNVDILEELLKTSPNPAKEEKGSWLKFEGNGDDRIPNHLDYPQMKGSKKRQLIQTHFPRRPTGISKDDLLFLTIVSANEENIPVPMIIGYASTDGFQETNKVADEEIKEHPWKDRYPYYIELKDGKVINASISKGLSLIDLYRDLGANTYPSLKNKTNVSSMDVHHMHFRRSHIRITNEAREYILKKLNEKFQIHGYISI